MTNHTTLMKSSYPCSQKRDHPTVDSSTCGGLNSRVIIMLLGARTPEFRVETEIHPRPTVNSSTWEPRVYETKIPPLRSTTGLQQVSSSLTTDPAKTYQLPLVCHQGMRVPRTWWELIRFVSVVQRPHIQQSCEDLLLKKKIRRSRQTLLNRFILRIMAR